MYKPLFPADNFTYCSNCHKRKHPNYGRAQNTLQRLAAQRNWDIKQVKGAIGNLRRVAEQRGILSVQNQLPQLEHRLLFFIDAQWKAQRMNEEWKLKAVNKKEK